MPHTYRYYRFRIRNAADDDDEVVISSVPGDENPFLLEPPNGDGLSFDPLTGKITTGTYTVRVIDNGNTANAVTPILADTTARQQLLSRVGIVELADEPTFAAPEELQHGYVNAIRGTALVFDFGVGDTQRKEVSTDVFKEATSRLNNTTALIGGPIQGTTFAGVRNYGGWGYRVNQVVTSPDYVQLKIVPGKIFDPRKANQGSDFRNLTTVSDALRSYTNSVARPYFEPRSTWTSVKIFGAFPGLQARIEETDGTVVGFFTPIAEPQWNIGGGHGPAPTDYLMRGGQSSLWIDNTTGVDEDGDTLGTWSPTVGHQYSVYVYIIAIGPDNPLHYKGHPVDLWELIRLDAGIPYDASVLPAAKAAVGNDVLLELRITQSYKIGDFDERVIYGPFGLSTRMVGGKRQLFSSRIKGTTVPSTVLTIDDLREPGKPFDLDESTAIKRVTLKQKRLVAWTTEETEQPTADAIIAIDSTTSIDNSDDDATVTGAGEVTYEIPGQITINGSYAGKFGPRIRQIGWLAGTADEIFDRWGRGIISCELECLQTVTALQGEELVLNLAHMPVSVVGNDPVTARGGQRIFQIVQRTETPSGPNLRLLDAGSAGDTEPGDDSALTVPTFTIAANADDPRKYADVTITNGPAIAALSGRIRVFVATGAGTPASGSGSLVQIIDPAVDDLTFTLNAFDAGTKVWVEMQTTVTDQRPSALSAFDSEQLDALDAVTSLAVSTQDAGDPSRRMLTWVVGANAADIPLEVLLRLTSESASANRVVAVLPAGSTQFELTGLDTANRTASVRHKESPPFSGASSLVTVAVNTSGSFRTLNPPISPRAFSNADTGVYGMDVVAVEFPSSVEFQVKVGVGGTFETIAIVTSEESGRTGFTDTAPNDGEDRYMRARHIADGLTESAWTATVSVSSWTTGPQTATGLPPGGADGDVLTKQSAADYDADWETPAASGGTSGFAHSFLTMGA